MALQDKVIPWDALARWREEVRLSGRTVAATNGCFDILHVGHVSYLEKARAEADLLLVGVNSDASVRELKGPSRPVNREMDRALVLAGLASVDAVCIFAERTAMEFLKVARPDVYVKGGDYTIDTINQEERRFVEGFGGRVVIIPQVHKQSTTAILERAGKK